MPILTIEELHLELVDILLLKVEPSAPRPRGDDRRWIDGLRVIFHELDKYLLQVNHKWVLELLFLDYLLPQNSDIVKGLQERVHIAGIPCILQSAQL